MHDDEIIEDDTKLDPPTKKKTATQKPSMWNVVFLNDDYTTMEFVVFALQKVFNRSFSDAQAITFQIHIDGKGLAGGPYTFEVAETKAGETMSLARREEFPLQVKLESVNGG